MPTTRWRPYMSRETLEYHHDKHHKAYVDNGNKLLEGSGLEGKSLEEIVKGSFGKNARPLQQCRPALQPPAFLAVDEAEWRRRQDSRQRWRRRSISDLGGVAKMKEDFAQAGVSQFGSGWAWLAVKDGKIAITKTPNGESPLVHGAKPILGCDVWEHSYYIDYRNRRPDYLKAFLDHLVNWDHVAEMYDAASK